ncbi:MAG: 2-amino-4-hydroxy-6-hydroxymethyldihydropteridine diphosphokinase [Enterobacteriaceae bacterium]
MRKVWISLGSNIKNPFFQIEKALTKIKKIPFTKLISKSSYYLSEPLGPKNQPNFLNVTIKIKTRLDPKNLLKYTEKIEIKQKRKRTKFNKWGPRTIDIDILIFDNVIIKCDKLIIPHYDLINRHFFIYPLSEISPNVFIPGYGCLKKFIK